MPSTVSDNILYLLADSALSVLKITPFQCVGTYYYTGEDVAFQASGVLLYFGFQEVAPMSYKFDSMLRILNMIDSGKTVMRANLAKELGVTVRSTDRYIATLRSAGFPINFDDERGSYVFEEGDSLSNTDFSTDEVSHSAWQRTCSPASAQRLARSWTPLNGK